MTLRHLHIFICVCEESNMTKAATRLHMSQPSISQAIRELEEHYSVHLFERLGHRLIITSAGDCLRSYASAMVRLDMQIESAMKDFGKKSMPRVGASITIGESFLVELLQYTKERHPEFSIFSEIHNTTELESMLFADTIDLALVEGSIQSDYITVIPFMVDDLSFICSCENPLAKTTPISVHDLQQQKFFIREAGSGTRDLFERVMNANHIPYEIAGVYNNAESLKKAVAANLGISVISRRAVWEEVKQKKLSLFSIDGLTFQRTFRIAYHKDKYVTPQLQKIITACHDLGQIDDFY